MKKFTLFCAVALLLSSVSIGCSSNGGSTSSWCRTGSIFPVARTKEATQVVYTAPASASNCDPCEPASCAPCDAVTCDPCEPVCDPCARYGGIVTRGVIPGPMN